MKKKLKEYLPVMIIGLLGIVILSIIGSGTLKETEDEKIVIYFPEIADFPNSEEGAVIFEFNFPNVGFKVGDKDADVLMFLNSKTIPGLYMGYNVKENRLKGGLPLIVSEEVALIDGQPHKLAYAFNRKEGKQWIYLDGKPIAEGEFTGEPMENLMTGFAVQENYDNYNWIESPYGVEGEVKNRFSGVII